MVFTMSGSTRVQELAEQIRYHADLYFNRSAPEITDTEFDALVDELKSLDPAHPALLEVGANPAYGEKVPHVSVMGSLEKCRSFAEVKSWFSACSSPVHNGVLMAPKVDGLSVELRYQGGRLHQAVTRGDGEKGQDVTANAMAIESIPHELVTKVAGMVRIRGEVYMKRSVFEQAGEGANPRNMASGKFTSKSPRDTASANLSFMAYDAILDGVSRDAVFLTEEAKLRWLAAEIGSQNVVPFKVFADADAALSAELFDWEQNVRPRLDYEIDGMVLSANSLRDQDEAGWAGRCPRSRIAYKFKPEQKVAEVAGVEWQVGRTGKVTPVLSILPTKIAGSTVSNLSLHNWGAFKALDPHRGDKVLIEKAGDIIPQVVRKCGETADPQPESLAVDCCPKCGSALVLAPPFLTCQNAACPSRLVRAVIHYLDCLEVLGIGPGIVERLCDAGMVRAGIQDLYSLDLQELVLMFGGTQGKNIYKAIMEKNEPPLHQFLDALGIDGLGTSTSKEVAKRFKKLAAVRLLRVEDLTAIEGIGDLTANKIVAGLAAMAPTIEALTGCIDVQEVKEVTGTLSGFSFCLTGAMSRLRGEIERDIERNGGTIKSCGKGLSFLVQADPSSTSAKSEKAKKLGIRIISEATLGDMMARGVTAVVQ